MRTSASDAHNPVIGATVSTAQFPTASAETTRNGDEKTQTFDTQVAMLLRAVRPASEGAEKQAELTPLEKRKGRRRDGDATPDANPLGLQLSTLVADSAKIDVAQRNANELRTRGTHTEAEQPPTNIEHTSGRDRTRNPKADRGSPPSASRDAGVENHGKREQIGQHSPTAAMAKQASALMPAHAQHPERARTESSSAAPHVNSAARSTSAESRAAVQPQPATTKTSERGQQSASINGIANTKSGRTDAFKQLLQAAQPTKRAMEQQQVAQVAVKAMGMALKEGGGEVVMKLAPEALGQVRVQLQVRDAVVDAVFTTTTAAARQLLEAKTDSLREALEARGLRVDSIVVDGPSKDARLATQHMPAAAQDAREPANSQGGALGGATDGAMNIGADARGGERQQHEAAQEAQPEHLVAVDAVPWDFAQTATMTAAGLEWVA
jgi:flagellar hook-length control protein FliK